MRVPLTERLMGLRGAILVMALASTSVVASAQPTYARDVSPILQQKCQGCHRPYDIAPFSLLTYDDVVPQARAIRAALQSGIMPPWKPIPGHGDFQNNRSLSDSERQTILDWIDAGTPAGDLADVPAPAVSTSEWRLGTPDQVLSMPEPYVPVARDDRPDRYRCFILPNIADQDRYVRAVDILPGQRQAVHHVLLFLTDDPAQIRLAQQFEAEDPDPGYDCWGGPRITPGAGPGLVKAAGGLLGGWVPGATPAELPPSIGTLVPKGAYVIMQVHYHLHDTDLPGADQTRVGLYFESKTPKNRLLSLPIWNDKFVLPPGASGQKVDAVFNLDLGTYGLLVQEAWIPQFSLILIAPHMHELGHRISAEVAQPDGTQMPLIEIDDWDFRWQGFYSYAAPVPLPYRSKITASCVFDNTTDRTVRWGESTQDEMCLVYIGFIAEGGVSSILFGNPQ